MVLTTHYLDEAEQLADGVAVLAGGRVVAEGTPASLRQEAAADTVVRFSLPEVSEPLPGLLEPLAGEATGHNGRITVVTPAPTADVAHITGWATARGIELESLAVESISFEDVYLRLIGQSSDAEPPASGSDPLTPVQQAIEAQSADSEWPAAGSQPDAAAPADDVGGHA